MNEMLVPHKRASIYRTCWYQGLTTSTLHRHMYVNKAHLPTFVYIYGYTDQLDVHSITTPVQRTYLVEPAGVYQSYRSSRILRCSIVRPSRTSHHRDSSPQGQTDRCPVFQRMQGILGLKEHHICHIMKGPYPLIFLIDCLEYTGLILIRVQIGSESPNFSTHGSADCSANL